MLEVCEQNQQIDTDTEHDAMHAAHSRHSYITRGVCILRRSHRSVTLQPLCESAWNVDFEPQIIPNAEGMYTNSNKPQAIWTPE